MMLEKNEKWYKLCVAIILTLVWSLGNLWSDSAAEAAQNRLTRAVQQAAAQAEAKQQSAARTCQLTSIRYGDAATRLRIVMDVSKLPDYSVVKENNGQRLVVNMNGIVTGLAGAPALKSNVVQDIILGKYGSDTVQLILDMKAPLETKVYTLANPNRLVIDVQKEYEQLSETEPVQGLKYTKYIRLDSRGMVTAYAMNIDPSRFKLGLALAGGNVASGRATVTQIAKSNGAVAAVNAGYFDTDGTLIGDTRIDGVTAGTFYIPRTGLGLMPDGSVKLGKTSYYGEVAIGSDKLILAGVNAPRGTNGLILYNELYGQYTGTNEYGMEYVIQNGRVARIQQNNTFIQPGTVVLSAHGTSKDRLAKLKVGDKVTIGETFGTELEEARTIIGAGPELVKNGVIHVTTSEEQVASDIARGRAPRTAMGVTADKHWVLLVIDGRQSHSIGATLQETGELLKKFGVVDGYNLDGGGSSAMYLKNRVVNKPSDGAERRVASAVVITQK